MLQIQASSANIAPHGRVVRHRHSTKVTRNRVIAGLLKELVLSLELEALASETAASRRLSAPYRH